MGENIPRKQTRQPNNAVDQLRRSIDAIDDEILRLLHARLSVAKQIGKCKRQGDIQVTDKPREKEIMNRLLKKNESILSGDGLRTIFEAIIAEGRLVQEKDQGSK